MITYVNAKNAEKYQVLFDKATKALNENPASEGSITIKSLARYFSVLKNLVDLDPTFIRLPLDEEPFEIDLNTRKISIPDSFGKNGVGVKGDQLAEIVYFKVNRFFEAQDLNNTEIYIEWSTGKAEGISKAFCVDSTSAPGYIIFGWAITSAMTKGGNATLTFAPRFIKEVDAAEDEITLSYSLSTLPHTLKIFDTLDLKDKEDVTVDETDADLIFGRVINSNLDGDDIINIDLDDEDFVWLVQPHGTAGNELWFIDSQVLTAEAKTTEGYLAYQWEKKEGTTWQSEGSLSAAAEYTPVIDYTVFRDVGEITAFEDDIVYYEVDEDGAYPGRINTDLNNIIHFKISTDTNPDVDKTYYVLYTGSDPEYGKIKQNVIYYVKNADNNGYIPADLSGYRPAEGDGVLYGRGVEENLIQYGAIYKVQSSFTVTSPGDYRVKAVVSQDAQNKTMVATKYSQVVSAAEPEVIPSTFTGALNRFDKAISASVDENSKYYDEATLEQIDNTKIASSAPMSVAKEGVENYPYNRISYKWYKDGEEIANAKEETYTATQPGVYTVEVINKVNGATASNHDVDNKATITALPEQPVAVVNETTTPGNFTLGQKISVKLSEDTPSQGFYYAWKKMVIDPTVEPSIDDNTEGNDISVWGTDLLPSKETSRENEFTPTEVGVYYCLVYNVLNGILASPLRVGNYIISEA